MPFVCLLCWREIRWIRGEGRMSRVCFWGLSPAEAVIVDLAELPILRTI